MRLLTKSGFAMATILAAIFGFAGLVPHVIEFEFDS